jgi:hypothetical protein
MGRAANPAFALAGGMIYNGEGLAVDVERWSGWRGGGGG